MLKAYKLDGKLKELKLIHSWERLMGKMIAKYTKEIYIKEKKLYIKIDSAPLRHELMYSREKIRTILNEDAGEVLIEDVILK